MELWFWRFSRQMWRVVKWLKREPYLESSLHDHCNFRWHYLSGACSAPALVTRNGHPFTIKNIACACLSGGGRCPNSPRFVQVFKCNHVWANWHILPFVASIDCQSSALFSYSQLLTGEKRDALLPTCILSATCARFGVNLTFQAPHLGNLSILAQVFDCWLYRQTLVGGYHHCIPGNDNVANSVHSAYVQHVEILHVEFCSRWKLCWYYAFKWK